MKKGLLLIGISISVAGHAQTVTTLCGSTEGYNPSTAAIADAKFTRPVGITVDPNENVWVTERNGHRIRMISGDWQYAYTRSGNTAQLTGDAGYLNASGGQAKWYGPAGIAVASDGSFVICDRENNCIRSLGKFVNVSNTQSAGHIAGGTGVGDAGYQDGAASTARFNQPNDVAVAANGDIYVCDTYNHCIRKIDGSTKVVSTVAGDASINPPDFADGQGSAAHFYLPSGICWDNNGDLLVADMNNFRIRRINIKSSPMYKVTTVAGNNTDDVIDGAIATASLRSPVDVICDKNGVIYVCEGGGAVSVIRKIAAGQVSTIAGDPATGGDTDGKGKAAKFENPQQLTFNKQETKILITDMENHRIRVLDPAGSGGGPNGIVAQPAWETINMYPNPAVAGGMVTLMLGNTNSGATLQLTDMTGKAMGSSQRLNANQTLLNTAEMPAGMYLVIITEANGRQTTGRMVLN